MDLFHVIIIFIYHFILATYGKKLTHGSSKASYDMDYAHSVVRRDIKDKSTGDVCRSKDTLDKETEKEIMKHPFPLKNDKNMDIQVVFVGEKSEKQLLLTTMPHSLINDLFQRHVSSHLYQSSDGGQTFQELKTEIKSASIRRNYGIMKSPVDPNWIIFISFTPYFSFSLSFPIQKHYSSLLISQDGCKNFTAVVLPFKLRTNEPLLFHPKKRNWIIALEEKSETHLGKVIIYGQAFISKDFGKTWEVMRKGHIAATVKWGDTEGKEDEIYISTHQTFGGGGIKSIFDTFSSASSLTLWRSLDGGDTFEEIIEHCFKFGVRGKFVYASVVFNVSGKGASVENKRIMHVSKDSGSTFYPINIPEITPQRFYSVLDMHKGMIFLHVQDPGDGKGTLYISGADGLMYTKSLDNHFYTHTKHTDFAKIEGMQGVYITQVLTKGILLKSVISFDRGVSWQPLYVDKGKYCNASGDCTLHFHNEYTNVKQNFKVQGPLSSSNAPGIIFLHGQAGDALTEKAQVWLSSNGGYNWTKIADSPHHYAIADSGNLLVVIPRINNTGNTLKYSIDQGRCWNDYKFHDNNEELVIHGLVTEPHAKERTFSIWGYAKDALTYEREWVVITINFHGMFSKKCGDADLEEWSPHTLNGKGGCFLGAKSTYARPLLTANCYLGNDFKPLLKTLPCKCTRDDIECDYGYEKQQDGKCKQNKMIKPIEICRNGEKMKVRFSEGYRRVPGDMCHQNESHNAVNDIIQYIDEKKKCEPMKEKIKAFGVIEEENKLAAELEKDKQRKESMDKKETGSHTFQVKSKHTRRKGNSFFVVIGILAVTGILLGGLWYGIKYIRSQRYVKPTYVMSDLLDEEYSDNGGSMYDPRPKTHRQFKDESDVEDDMMLPV